jgi:NitT/TauT family transport system ATP-binding protein
MKSFPGNRRISTRLKCLNICKTFYTRDGEIKALDDVNFQVKEREFLCVLGPSGCGKTTLLKIISKLLPSTSGEVVYGERDSNNHSCAMVFQEHGLFPWMRVLDNVAFGLEVKRVAKKERQKISLRFLERLGLLRFARNYPHQLSLGMQQRVGLARAFASGSKILLMDEPFG